MKCASRAKGSWCAWNCFHGRAGSRPIYEKLRERGKSFKVAITACMRKIIVILNAMIRDRRLWNPKYA